MHNPIKPYRKCVVAVIYDPFCGYLVGERSDMARPAWQFPQGGMEENETPEESVLREIKEEIGMDSLKIIKTGNCWVSYDFPPHFGKHALAQKYQGQEQLWFLLEFTQKVALKDLKRDDEFRDFKWSSLTTIVENIVDFKKQSYKLGLKSLDLT